MTVQNSVYYWTWEEAFPSTHENIIQLFTVIIQNYQ
ncbi:MAG: hypothetical protein MAG581_00905 [Deltaproteobacteria bacterium]|jgi:hypothetical protein|nr:hypothetical protein [Deltaproteobacteria bacterium]